MRTTSETRGAKAQDGAPAAWDADSMLAAITAIVREVCDNPAIRLTPETRTADIPAWEEMTRAGIAVEAECRFGVMFHASDVIALRTVGDLIDLIARKRAMAHA